MRWSIIVFLTIIGTASSVANAQFSFATFASFTDPGNSGPAAGLVMDAQGNLFGTTIGVGLPFFDGSPSTDGSVFELPSGSNTIFRQISGHFHFGSSPNYNRKHTTRAC